jgi:hypothetical protein
MLVVVAGNGPTSSARTRAARRKDATFLVLNSKELFTSTGNEGPLKVSLTGNSPGWGVNVLDLVTG